MQIRMEGHCDWWIFRTDRLLHSDCFERNSDLVFWSLTGPHYLKEA